MAVDSAEEYEAIVNRAQESGDNSEILDEASQQARLRKTSEEALTTLEKRLKDAGDGQGTI